MQKKVRELLTICVLFAGLSFTVLAKEPLIVTPSLKHAMELSRHKKFDNAIKEIYEVMNSTGTDIRQAHVSLGLVYFKSKQYDNSIEEFSKVIQIKKESPMAYYFTGLLYEKKAKTKEVSKDDAKNFKRKALASWKDYLDASAKTENKISESHKHIGLTKKEALKRSKKHIKVLEEELEDEKN